MQILIDAYAKGKSIIDQQMLDDPLIDENDALVRAEGYRWVSRILNGLQGRELGNDASPAFPTIHRLPTNIFKLGWDSPDYTYVTLGPLDAEFTYRVYGKRNTVDIILMQVMNKGGYGGGAELSSEDLVVDKHGNYEIILSADKPRNAKNWLQLNERSDVLSLRHIFNDWSNVEASVAIEVIDGPEQEAPVLDVPFFSRAVQTLTQVALFSLDTFSKTAIRYPLHEFPVPCAAILTGCKEDEKMGGSRDILYTVSRYHVPEGKALIVEVPHAAAKFRNIQLGNIWTESLDYANKQTSLNSHQDYLDKDGTYRYILSHQDQGYNNWLDIKHHPYGSMMMRWILADPNDPAVAPKATLVDVEDLKNLVPATHKRVSLEERQAVIKERKQQFNYRINPAGIGL